MIGDWTDKREEEEHNQQQETVKHNEPANEDGDDKTAEEKIALAEDKADMHQTQEGNKSKEKEYEDEQRMRLKTRV
jgi:hypothetical protein